MVTKPVAPLLVIQIVLALNLRADAAPLRGPLEVTMEAIVNPAEGSPGPTCVSVGEVEPHGRMESWVAFGDARSHPQRAWEGTSSGIRCGNGPLGKARADLERLTGTPYLIVGVSAAERPLHEGVRLLDLSLSLLKLSGFAREGGPVYEPSAERRSFVLSREGETLVPLLVANAREREAFALHEVLLRVEARRTREGSAAAYGAISVTSGMDGAELLLDGGAVGRISKGTETVLRNVRVGEHEVAVRGSSGREVRRWVRLEADRTVPVALNLAASGRSPVPYRLVPLGKNPQGHEEYRRERDGAEVVNIPASEFLMGNRETERHPLEHRVSVSRFLIDKTEVTWGRYERFAEATGTALPPDEPWWGIRDDHPVVFVTWEEAKAYCDWVGGRLPTEAEWESACRGTDGRTYPWGNEEPDPERAVHRRSWGFAATDPVGAHPKGASAYGLLDMGGSVWEWCADWYDDRYYELSPSRDPRGPSSGQAHVVRGGSWDSRPTVLSCSCRSWGHRGYREGDFGFRCAMDAPE